MGSPQLLCCGWGGGGGTVGLSPAANLPRLGTAQYLCLVLNLYLKRLPAMEALPISATKFRLKISVTGTHGGGRGSRILRSLPGCI